MDPHAALVLGLQHHLGYGKTYDPELASAWIHAAAWDGDSIAKAVVDAMQQFAKDKHDTASISFAFKADITPELEPFFNKTDSGDYTLNLSAALQWNQEKASDFDPEALYNCYVIGAPIDQIRYLFVYTCPWYRRPTMLFPELETNLHHWLAHPELYNHADTWMFTYQNGLKTSGLSEASIANIDHAIKAGSSRARLYRMKYLSDTILSEEDNKDIRSYTEELDQLLQENYPPAWEIKCQQLQLILDANDASTEESLEPTNYFETIHNAVRFGYEFSSLRLLGTLLARSKDPTIFHHGFQIYQQAANMGMHSAFYSVGFCYRNGFGVEKDVEQAQKWFEKGEENNDPAASYQLAWLLMNKDHPERAFESFKSSAEKGYGSSQLQCGLMLLEGFGVEPNKEEAYRWFEAAAAQGDDTANLFCGYFHDNAWLGERDIDQALYFYRESVKSLSDESFSRFFSFLKQRLGDDSATIEAMLMVTDELLHWVPSNHLVELGVRCWNRKTSEASMRWDRANHYFEAAKEKGHPLGQLMLYVLCINGYPNYSTSDAVAFLESTLQENDSQLSTRFRDQVITALSEAYLHGMGAPMSYESYLALIEREKPSMEVQNRLDEAAQHSNAYKIYRERANHSTRFQRAQFSARKSSKQCPPEAIIKIKPEYPRYLREMGISGKVILSMTVDKEGGILAPQVVSSTHAGFEEPAMRALEHWKFLPGLQNGEAVKTKIRLPLIFSQQ